MATPAIAELPTDSNIKIHSENTSNSCYTLNLTVRQESSSGSINQTKADKIRCIIGPLEKFGSEKIKNGVEIQMTVSCLGSPIPDVEFGLMKSKDDTLPLAGIYFFSEIQESNSKLTKKKQDLVWEIPEAVS